MFQTILDGRGRMELTLPSKFRTSRRSTVNASDIGAFLEKEKKGYRILKSDVMSNMLHDEEKAKKSIHTYLTKRQRHESSQFIQKSLSKNEISLPTDLHLLKNAKNNLQKAMNLHKNYTNDTLIKSIFKDIFSKNRDNITHRRGNDFSTRKTEDMKRSFQIHNPNQRKREDTSLVRKLSNFDDRMKCQGRITLKEISVNKITLSSQKSISAKQEEKSKQKVIQHVNQWENTVKLIRKEMQKYKMSKSPHRHCEIVINRINTEQISTSRPIKAKKYQYIQPIKHQFPVAALNQSLNIPISLHKAPLNKIEIENILVNPWSTSEIKMGQDEVPQFHL